MPTVVDLYRITRLKKIMFLVIAIIIFSFSKSHLSNNKNTKKKAIVQFLGWNRAEIYGRMSFLPLYHHEREIKRN